MMKMEAWDGLFFPCGPGGPCQPGVVWEQPLHLPAYLLLTLLLVCLVSADQIGRCFFYFFNFFLRMPSKLITLIKTCRTFLCIIEANFKIVKMKIFQEVNCNN